MFDSKIILRELLNFQASRQGESPALLTPGRAALSYLQLYQQFEKTVQRLRQFGLAHPHRVAIVLPNGPEMAVCQLGVAACATSAPLNPAYRADDFDFFLDDLDAQAVIVAANLDSAVREVAAARAIPIIELASDPKTAGVFTLTCDSVKATFPIPIEFPSASETALILHTSGTTARPKMVPLSQSNLLRSASNIGKSLALSQTDRCLNVMPLFHIHGFVAGLLASLATGGSVVCTPGFDAAHFFSWFKHCQPTWYTAVPTMHQAILAQAALKPVDNKKIRLRFIRSSSASLPPQIMMNLEQTFDAPVIEAYGMTEAAHQICSNPLPPAQRKAGSVGLSAGSTVAVMGIDNSDLLPAGTTGEIVIRGDNVMAGYLNHPNANQQAFSGDWFRTGDQGYLDDAGYLFITGRLKEMINRGGEKVAPREIDEALLAHPAVRQAAAFSVPHATLGEDVVAAVVVDDTQDLSEQELRHFLFGRIADHKIPSQIVRVQQIPVGATGKVQRMDLAKQLAEHLRTPYIPPTTEFEKLLTQIWQEVLSLERLGVADNFFAAGGDSLSAMRVTAHIHQKLGIEIQPSYLFASPTIRELAMAIIVHMLEEQTSVEKMAMLCDS